MKGYGGVLCHALIFGAVILWGWGIESGWAQEGSIPGVEQPAEEPLPSVPSEAPDTEAVPVESPSATAGEVIIPETPAGEEGETEDVIRYAVKKGDTLWGITRSIWQDPFLWPKVWRSNPYILNPDLIYPGNVIIFPAVLMELEEMKPPVPMPPPPKVTVAPPVEIPPEPVRPEPDLALLASSGFVLFEPEPSGTVVGSQDGRDLLGENDIAYILPASSATFETGDRVILYRNVRKVYHPKTRKYVGDLIKILGVAQAIGSSERVRTAQIMESYDYITKEDSTLPYQLLASTILPAETPLSREDEESQATSPLNGYIIEVKDDRVSNAQFDIVYLDKGLRDGLRRGDHFVVIREGEKISRDERLPRRLIGRLEILMAQDATSTAQVIQSTEVIHKGDLFESPPSP